MPITTSGTISGLAVGNTLRTKYMGPAPSLSSSQTVPYERTMAPRSAPSTATIKKGMATKVSATMTPWRASVASALFIFALHWMNTPATARRGVYAGVAGSLLAIDQSFVAPTLYYWSVSGEVLLMELLGGMGTLYGPVLGAFAFLLLEDLDRKSVV